MKKIIMIVLLLFCVTGCKTLDFDLDFNSYESNGSSKVLEIEDGKNQVELNYENKLIAHYLDVGQADSIFVELPNQKSMLIDAGESSSSEKIIEYIKKLGYTKIDYVIGTHPHADHIGGLAKVIETFDIGSIFMPNVIATSKTYENLLMTISNKNLKIKTGKAGVEIFSEEGLTATIVAPNSDKYSGYNNYSIVIKLIYGKTSYLFTGDAESLSEKEITADIDVDVLKVGHHGSDTSSSVEFLEKVTPEYAIISVGENNSYGHPSSLTLENLKKYTNEIYRTDLNGTITVASDGYNIAVETEK